MRVYFQVGVLKVSFVKHWREKLKIFQGEKFRRKLKKNGEKIFASKIKKLSIKYFQRNFSKERKLERKMKNISSRKNFEEKNWKKMEETNFASRIKKN